MNTDLVKTTEIDGLFVLEHPTYPDNRGFFREVFHLDELVKITGVDFMPVQMNHSLSIPGVIRAIHAENWNKLIYPVSGKMFAAVADIRADSPTFAKVEKFIFDDSHRYGLLISKGLANSICAVEGEVNYIYLVDAYYDGKDVRAVAWDDPDLKIDWPIKNPIVSDRDKANPKLRDLFPEKFT